jgi:hypothetical protein
MAIGRLLEERVAFLRVEQPAGAPSTGFSPLLALLRRQISENEIADMATQLARNGVSTVGVTDIGLSLPRSSMTCRPSVTSNACRSRLIVDGWTIQQVASS